ncbi:hypothetical protein E2C01_098166 [Portunus trituberculatus]|uniref:Uncharacterized protein n=1 Tax=Portunus trituberculatus TaxID=210409 RepID=A0A5B7KDC1_PORTR|nr:hypothetical protein [Portunus trituberculatus]
MPSVCLGPESVPNHPAFPLSSVHRSPARLSPPLLPSPVAAPSLYPSSPCPVLARRGSTTYLLSPVPRPPHRSGKGNTSDDTGSTTPTRQPRVSLTPATSPSASTHLPTNERAWMAHWIGVTRHATPGGTRLLLAAHTPARATQCEEQAAGREHHAALPQPPLRGA